MIILPSGETEAIKYILLWNAATQADTIQNFWSVLWYWMSNLRHVLTLISHAFMSIAFHNGFQLFLIHLASALALPIPCGH